MNKAPHASLTSAHVVADHTFQQVQRTGTETPDKFVATVFYVCNDCDLATLDVNDDAFSGVFEPRPLDKCLRSDPLSLSQGFPLEEANCPLRKEWLAELKAKHFNHTRRQIRKRFYESNLYHSLLYWPPAKIRIE